jgi:biotin operon repressor
MINLFRKKKDPEIVRIHSNLDNSFSRLGNDIDYIQRWIRHLHDKHESFEQKHNSHIELTRKDIDSLSRWINYLNKHNIETKTYLKQLLFHVDELQKKDKELLDYVKKLENSINEKVILLQGHLGTLERTTKGQLKDMSLSLKSDFYENISSVKKEFDLHKIEFENDRKKLDEISKLHQEKKEQIDKIEKEKSKEISKEISNNTLIKQTTSSVKDKVASFIETKSSLSGSQLELLNVLYEADRPLSYGDLSKILNKKSKSIRNLIYELREAGLEVKSRFIGLRTKGFFLTKETKILVSGR